MYTLSMPKTALTTLFRPLVLIQTEATSSSLSPTVVMNQPALVPHPMTIQQSLPPLPPLQDDDGFLSFDDDDL
jgi:hypothetical protein